MFVVKNITLEERLLSKSFRLVPNNEKIQLENNYLKDKNVNHQEHKSK